MTGTLSASSLLLAALALVYSQWYPEITDTLRRNENAKDKHYMDRKLEFDEVRQVLLYRSLPLLISTLLLVLVLLPEAIEITLSSARMYRESGLKALLDYSTVSTAYVLSVLLAAAFCVHLGEVTLRTQRLKKDLRPIPRS